MIVIDQNGSGTLTEQLAEERASNLIFAACSAVSLAVAVAFLGCAEWAASTSSHTRTFR